MARAFVIRPFGRKQDSAGAWFDFDRVHEELIAPALVAAGLAGSTTGEVIEAGNIREDMFALIIEADVVVCDITVHNANVFYELGMRHGLRMHHTVMIRGEPVADGPPFDILTDRYLTYDAVTPGVKRDALTEVLKATLASTRVDSPVFKMLPGLPETDPATIQVVPLDFTEEVARARAAKSAGWLRLMASEIIGQRFEQPGLRMIGEALWNLNDIDGATKVWESVRTHDRDNVAANLALANLYERASRKERSLQLLETSNQAIARVLKSVSIGPNVRAEALALSGRNVKTAWRADFDSKDTESERRATAANRALLRSYEAYRQAYLVDLNHYYSGLAALQMGMIALDLSQESYWQDVFPDDKSAAAYAEELTRDVPSLQATVELAIKAQVERLPLDNPERFWAEISAADRLFLTENRSNRVIKAYLDAVPVTKPFAWDAARGQLTLFSRLGVRAELADAVINAVDEFIGPIKANGRDLHVVVFAGHRIDEDRTEPRFPEHAVERASSLIRAELERLVGTGDVRVLASGAPGADILCHELCIELGLDRVMCLPMPKETFAGSVFGQADGWRSRFLALTVNPPLELSDRDGLSPWLQATGADRWERGNQWVIDMALTSGATTVSLIALWDGRDTDDPRGGTAHIVRRARATGEIDVRVIDAKQLLT